MKKGPDNFKNRRVRPAEIWNLAGQKENLGGKFGADTWVVGSGGVEGSGGNA